MFQRRGLGAESPSYSKQQTIRWLHRLVVQLTSTSQTVFLIERMQPDWLTSRRSRWAFGAPVWATFIVMATAVGYRVIDPGELPLGLLICGTLFVRMFGNVSLLKSNFVVLLVRYPSIRAKDLYACGLNDGPLLFRLKTTFQNCLDCQQLLIQLFHQQQQQK